MDEGGILSDSKEAEPRRTKLRLDQELVDKHSIIRKSLQSDSYYRRHRQKARKEPQAPSNELSQGQTKVLAEKKRNPAFSHIPLSFMASLTPKSSVQPKPERGRVSASNQSQPKQIRTISNQKLPHNSKNLHQTFEDENIDSGRKKIGNSRTDTGQSSQFSEQQILKESRHPTRQSLLRAAQDHYSKKPPQRSELELSPSLMKSSKISQSYKQESNHYDQSKSEKLDSDLN